MKEYVILVDETDHKIGQEEKMKAHELGLLHRAFSVLVFNKSGQLLLQQRAKEKYHCGGLWTNTVCSHPRPGEDDEAAVHRRLQEEFGFDCPITYQFHVLYQASFNNGLTEHEYDKVYIGHYDGTVQPDKNEIMNYKRESIPQIKEDIHSNPENYTARFKIIMQKWGE